MKTKELYCANCQELTVHNATVDGNGEYVFTCTTEDCGRFLKLPADVATKTQAQELFEAHATQNEGQLTVEAQEKKLDSILGESEPEE